MSEHEKGRPARAALPSSSAPQLTPSTSPTVPGTALVLAADVVVRAADVPARDLVVVPVADGVRYALALAEIDPTPLGIRDRGPLNWEPDEVPPEGGDHGHHPTEPPVAVARRAELARQHRRELDEQLRCGRWIVERFGGAE